MQNLWNDSQAKKYKTDLELRVYSSQLLGQNPSLVLHGGGNTSVKVMEKNILGVEEEILYVKGSGWDLISIEAPGFAPVRLKHLCDLAELEQLSDPQMVNELKTNMTNAAAPTPSVEAILHATLPFKYVDHSHADAVVTITNTKEGKQRIKEIYGDKAIIIDYIMPGFDLARLCAKQFAEQVTDKTEALILLNHGIFTFGATAKESYQRHIQYVSMAEDYLKQQNAWDLEQGEIKETDDATESILKLRNNVSATAGFPVILKTSNNKKCIAFSQRDDLEKIAQQGPATPDHVIRTKQLPMLGTDVKQYTANYKKYFNKNSAGSDKVMLDAAPRMLLDNELGFIAIGKTAKDADIVEDIYQHTTEIILRAEALGGYKALADNDIFDMEYWVLEQAKLKKGGNAPEFTGEIALVTGGASGIGKACVEALLAKGAAVVAVDINPNVTDMLSQANYLGIVCDVSSEAEIINSIKQTIKRFGGLDMLILNAGLFPLSSKIAEISTQDWRKVMQVNLDANLIYMREAHSALKQAPNGGRVVMLGSKNVLAPGPGAVAYSASKAALTQMARIAALEWGADNIRINTLHPDAIFDTAIWTEEVLNARAKHYGMSVEDYKCKNILKTELKSSDVADLAAAMCGKLFAKTTGAQLPVDGGNDRVI
ncbi:Short-chain dehydrogenase [hydrothermal vent metagenome]|uniref:Short-chain dehydrogenase n=1 Tax=hydrothermal vent metagenome TaxID=652676 RepID=A0A3B1A6A0_9ZZZZ